MDYLSIKARQPCSIFQWKSHSFVDQLWDSHLNAKCGLSVFQNGQMQHNEDQKHHTVVPTVFILLTPPPPHGSVTFCGTERGGYWWRCLEPRVYKLNQQLLTALINSIIWMGILSEAALLYYLPAHGGQLLMKRICSFRSKFFPLRVELTSKCYRNKQEFMQVNITLFLEKRQVEFN